MKWRTDNPTEKTIVAQLCEDWGDRYEMLFLNEKPYLHYVDSHGEDVPYSAIKRWLSPSEGWVPKRGYDPEYMQSCIDKATKSWEGVDVDEFMKEVRPDCAYHRTYEERLASCLYCSVACPSRILDFDTELFFWLKKYGNDETRQLIEITARRFWNQCAMRQEAKIMKDAVEGHVCGRVQNHINIKVEGVDELEPKGVMHILADKSKYKIGDKVKVIILKVEEEK